MPGGSCVISPAEPSAVRAASSDLPIRFGTCTCAGPVETKIVTLEPTGMRVPTAGSECVTLPLSTVSLASPLEVEVEVGSRGLARLGLGHAGDVRDFFWPRRS